MVDRRTRHISHPIFPSTEPLSLGQLRKGERIYTLQGYIRKREGFSSRPCWQAIYYVSTLGSDSGMRLKIWHSGRCKSKIDLEPEQLTWITQKQRNVPRARGDSLLQLTERACEHPSLARTVEDGQVVQVTAIVFLSTRSPTVKFCIARRSATCSRSKVCLLFFHAPFLASIAFPMILLPKRISVLLFLLNDSLVQDKTALSKLDIWL